MKTLDEAIEKSAKLIETSKKTINRCDTLIEKLKTLNN